MKTRSDVTPVTQHTEKDPRGNFEQRLAQLVFRDYQLVSETWRNPTYSSSTENVKSGHSRVITWEEGKRKDWHFCDHVKETTSTRAAKLEMNIRYHTPSVASRVFSGPLGRLQYKYSIAANRIPNPIRDSEKELQSLDWRAAYESLLDDASGLLPDDLSIALNVAEFAQLKGLVKALSKPITRIIKYATGHPNRKIKAWQYLKDKQGKVIPWTLSYDTVELRSFKWCLQDLASTHLGMQFGVLPLADDLARIASKYWEVKTHLAWYRQVYHGKEAWFHSRTPTQRQAAEQDLGSVYSRSSSDHQFEARLYSKEEVETYGLLHAKIHAEPKSETAQQCALLNQALGLNVPLQLAWELIPFSFVVDWFLPVKEVLRRVEPRRAIGGLCRSLTMRETWHTVVHRVSHALEVRESIWKTDSTPNYGAFDYSHTFEPGYSKVEYQRYIRQRGIPSLNYMPIARSRFGLKEAVTSVSLFIQRAFRGSPNGGRRGQ